MQIPFIPIATVALFFALFATPAAHAQFAVSTPDADAELTTANISLAAQAVSAAKTAATVSEALGVAKDTYDAIGSGNTIFGNLSFQPDDSLPGDARSTLNLVGSTGAASDVARSIRQDASSIDKPFFGKVNPFAKNTLSGDMDSAVSAAAANEDIYANAKLHAATLERLRVQIGTTTSLKDTADLSARIQLENADIANELVKVQALENMEEHNDKVRELQTKQSLFGRNSRSY
jgi:type IV secretion system protein VirB5